MISCERRMRWTEIIEGQTGVNTEIVIQISVNAFQGNLKKPIELKKIGLAKHTKS